MRNIQPEAVKVSVADKVEPVKIAETTKEQAVAAPVEKVNPDAAKVQ